jgi:hypothetical protein
MIREERLLRERIVLDQVGKVSRVWEEYQMRRAYKIQVQGVAMWDDTDEARHLRRNVINAVAVMDDAINAEIDDACLAAFFGPETVTKRRRHEAREVHNATIIQFPAGA